MKDWKSFEDDVAHAIRANSIIFLRRAADEIASHENSGDKGFDHETGTVVSVLTQMALELAVASFLIRHDGIRTILTKPETLTDAQIRDKWSNNELRTKTFEEYKKILAEKHSGTFSVFEDIVELFQNSRNKIVHLHYRFDEADLYDLKYESTFVLIHVVSCFIFEDDYNHASNLASILTDDTFHKLIRSEPYQYYVEKIAKEYSKVVLNCLECGHHTFSDRELKCYSCTYEAPFLRLLSCPKCSETSVVYDHLNLDLNLALPTLCLKCGDRREVFKCTSCRNPVIGGRPYRYCTDCSEEADSTPSRRP